MGQKELTHDRTVRSAQACNAICRYRMNRVRQPHHPQRLASVQPPQPHGAIFATADDGFSDQGDGSDRTTLTSQKSKKAALANVPDTDRTVLARRQGDLSVLGDREVANRPPMAFKDLDASFLIEVPDPDRAVSAGRDNSRTGGVPGDSADKCGVALERLHALSALKVPKPEAAIGSTACNHLPIRRRIYADRNSGMGPQAPQMTSVGKVEESQRRVLQTDDKNVVDRGHRAARSRWPAKIYAVNGTVSAGLPDRGIAGDRSDHEPIVG